MNVMRLIIVALVMSIIWTNASAQVRLFGRAGLDLSQSDIAKIQAAARTLYVNQSPVKNTQTSWNNPETGNSGKVKIAGINAGPPKCISIAHQISIKGTGDPKIFVFKRCKSASGTWDPAG